MAKKLADAEREKGKEILIKFFTPSASLYKRLFPYVEYSAIRKVRDTVAAVESGTIDTLFNEFAPMFKTLLTDTISNIRTLELLKIAFIGHEIV